jgi:hypothetical protein
MKLDDLQKLLDASNIDPLLSLQIMAMVIRISMQSNQDGFNLGYDKALTDACDSLAADAG